jgi:hypothetical protein
MLNIKTLLFENSFLIYLDLDFSYIISREQNLNFLFHPALLSKNHLHLHQRGGFPQQNDFRTYCMSDEAEKVNQKLEKIIGTC